MAEIREEVAVNPDAQAAVTDFLDYTEYLPTDLIRSLTLIQLLDETYLENADSVHELTQTYGSLPSIPANERPDASKLRSGISRHLDLAISARESAYAEAVRLFDLTDRHQDRLKSIIAKLNALPKPPSRDPTPQPQPASAAKRSKAGRRLESSTIPRLMLKPLKGTIATSILPRPRHRRITVPGEVQPPFDPDEPIASTEVSDWESDAPNQPKPISNRKSSKPREDRKQREPREIATYRKPTPPPDDAVNGSKWRPWTRLSDYEMYRLRKKMKKNHTWEPSEVMIRRELAEKGRGWDNYLKAKAEAEKTGMPFIDINVAPEKPAVSLTLKTEAPKMTPKPDAPPRPKTIKRTESKREKDKDKDKEREREKEKEKEKTEEPPKEIPVVSAQDPDIEVAARKLGDIGSAFKNLFSPFSSALASLKTVTSTPTPTPAPAKTELKASKKRKLESNLSTSPSVEPARETKRPKLMPKPSPLNAAEPTVSAAVQSTSAGTIRIPSKIPPLKLNVSQPAPIVTTTPTPARATRPAAPAAAASQAIKSDATPPPVLASRPPSRRSTAASVEPSTSTSMTTRSSARNSETPAAIKQKTPVLEPQITPKSALLPAQTAASQRPRRSAPGAITQSNHDGGATVSVSIRNKPKAKANKQQILKVAASPVPEIRTDIDGNKEIINPDEETYCICEDVSWGQMICCELDDKVCCSTLSLLKIYYANDNLVRARSMVPHGLRPSARSSTTNRQMVLP